MQKTIITVIAVALFVVTGSVAMAAPAQPASQSAAAGPGMKKMSKPENRMARLSRGLDLTEEQKAKIKPILEDESAKVESVLDNSNLSRQQKRTRIREIHAATFEQIKTILTPEQLKKHEEMMKSAKKMSPGMRNATPDNRLQRLSTTLNLSEEQKAKIKPMLEDESTEVKAVLDDSNLSRQQKRTKIRDIHADTFEQIKTILTPEQLKKHEEMMKKWKK
jgi:Spy/CpxP family protein refolding chaperone